MVLVNGAHELSTLVEDEYLSIFAKNKKVASKFGNDALFNWLFNLNFLKKFGIASVVLPNFDAVLLKSHELDPCRQILLVYAPREPVGLVE
jgi:hypothetical protein